jgi:hypothetical protein
LQFRDIEIDKQSKWKFCQAHVRKNLRVMDWEKCFDTFYFNVEIVTNEQIDPTSAIEQNVLLTNGQRHLHLKWNTGMREFARQTLAIDRFEQSRPEIAVNFDRAPDHTSGQLIKFHLRVLRDLRGA